MSSSPDASSLVTPGALKTAVHELSSRIASVQEAFITSGTNLGLVKNTTIANQELNGARKSFLDFYLEAQKTATEAGASIASFQAAVKTCLPDISSAQASQAIDYLAKNFGDKEKPRYDFRPVVTHLSKTRAATETMLNKLAAVDKKALDAAIARVNVAEAIGEKLKEEFMAVVPDILKKFGVSEDSPSLTLYLTLAPYLFLESVISKWMGGDDEDSDDDSKKPVNKDKKKKPTDDDEEEASDDKKTNTDDKTKDDKKDKKKDEDKSKVLPDAVRRAGKSNVTIKKVIALQKKMDANKREIEEAKVALNRLKEDQSLDDQQARLQTVLIDIQNIQGDIADISPKIRMLGTVYDSMSRDLAEVGNLLKAGNPVEAKSSLEAANKVYTELEPALGEFSTAA